MKWLCLLSTFGTFFLFKMINKIVKKKIISSKKSRFKSYLQFFSIKPPIYKICLTGGPCAGKTTVINSIKNKLRDKGINSILIPEIPTLIVKGGVSIKINEFTIEENLIFFETYMKLQNKIEKIVYDLSLYLNEKIIILCDRGLLDGVSYMKKEIWDILSEKNEWRKEFIRDGVYNVLFHLVTVADGAESIYSLNDNIARHESPETAKFIDKLIQNTCLGHPQMFIIDNLNKGIQEKIDLVWDIVKKQIGEEEFSKKHKIIVESFYIPSDLNIVTKSVKSFKKKLNSSVTVKISESYVNHTKLFHISIKKLQNTKKIILKKQNINGTIYYRIKSYFTESKPIIKDFIYFIYLNQVLTLVTKENKIFIKYYEKIPFELPNFIKIKKIK